MASKSEKMRELYRSRSARGMCIYCGKNPATPGPRGGMSYCDTCQAKKRMSRRKNRSLEKEREWTRKRVERSREAVRRYHERRAKEMKMGEQADIEMVTKHGLLRPFEQDGRWGVIVSWFHGYRVTWFDHESVARAYARDYAEQAKKLEYEIFNGRP